jgi:hypothetical protein
MFGWWPSQNMTGIRKKNVVWLVGIPNFDLIVEVKSE